MPNQMTLPGCNPSRHLSVFNPDLFNQFDQTSIHIIGANHLGSRIALELSKLGISGQKIRLYDCKKIQNSTQAKESYCHSDIGQPKITATQKQILDTIGINIKTSTKSFDSNRPTGIVFLTENSISEKIWKKYIRYNYQIKLLIYPSFERNNSTIYTVRPYYQPHVSLYESYLKQKNTQSKKQYTITPTSDILCGQSIWQFIRWFDYEYGRNDDEQIEEIIELPCFDYPFSANKFNATDIPIHIIGSGSTGSKIALSLTRMGIKGDNITVYDFDLVESHNIANQAFRNQDVGQLKTEALQNLIHETTNEKINIQSIKVDGSQKFSGIVFLLTDTMESRKKIWHQAIKFNHQIKLMIETRMGTDNGRIYAINPFCPTHVNSWENSLCESTEVETSACGTRTTIGATSNVISGFAVKQFIQWFDQTHGQTNQILKNETIFCLRPHVLMSKSF